MSMLAKDLRIGDKIRKPGSDETTEVKELNELCPSNSSPHVHALTTAGPYCFGFNMYLAQAKHNLVKVPRPKTRMKTKEES